MTVLQHLHLSRQQAETCEVELYAIADIKDTDVQLPSF